MVNDVKLTSKVKLFILDLIMMCSFVKLQNSIWSTCRLYFLKFFVVVFFFFFFSSSSVLLLLLHHHHNLLLLFLLLLLLLYHHHHHCHHHHHHHHNLFLATFSFSSFFSSLIFPLLMFILLLVLVIIRFLSFASFNKQHKVSINKVKFCFKLFYSLSLVPYWWQEGIVLKICCSSIKNN